MRAYSELPHFLKNEGIWDLLKMGAHTHKLPESWFTSQGSLSSCGKQVRTALGTREIGSAVGCLPLNGPGGEGARPEAASSDSPETETGLSKVSPSVSVPCGLLFLLCRVGEMVICSGIVTCYSLPFFPLSLTVIIWTSRDTSPEVWQNGREWGEA